MDTFLFLLASVPLVLSALLVLCSAIFLGAEIVAESLKLLSSVNKEHETPREKLSERRHRRME
jgi:hypothetical protein